LNEYLDLRQKDSLLYKEQSIFDKNKLNDSQKSTQRTLSLSRVNHTVVRKFPGPAGLLFKDNDECEQRDRNYVDESNKNISTIVCSQNTKNLFHTGAWQLMMDDMPSNCELFNIANIKDKAIEFSKILKKIPYLAGIIEYINYKPNNPHIIIKDLSGQIDACIHHTICKIYPNMLGTNTVILLKDVRLIVTSKKYVCIIISIKNLVSIYSDHLRLVQTNLL
ncbi:PREDICTED: uncharacterized protein LOC105366550, partial [Ceratosolen solmsi marchali]|uniref:Uncharacterized protein LOC105366550 n=1 Tax=Ceratosolen solmsi marchali TaxID=326594 RepID=A0AAJ6YSC5_9HYME